MRAKDAAIAGFGAKHRLAASAFVEELAGVSWHRFSFGETANRTYQHRIQKTVAHARLSMTAKTLSSSLATARLLLYSQNRVLCRFGDSELHDGLGWNLDPLPRHIKTLKRHRKAHARAKTAATTRWKTHCADKSLATAIAELEKVMQNRRRKLHTVAIVSSEPYDSLIDGCINEVARVLREKY